MEEAESEDSGDVSSIRLAEVSEAVKKLRSGKAPGVDEICPEMLKALDIVGLSWLTRLFSVAWMSGTVPVELQTGVVVSIFKKGDRRVYSRMLERRPWPIVEPQIQEEEQCGFRPERGTVDQLFTLAGLLGGGVGVCPSRSTCVLWTWRRLSTVSFGGSCGRY